MNFLAAAAAFSGFLAVALGAFGAHGLKERLAEGQRAEHWKTAFTYQMAHTLLLLIVSQWADRFPQASLIGWLLLAGIVLFSGSLYLLAFSGIRRLGAITPLGGLAWLAAWLLLCWNMINN
jgi:uncharacterized membrane protein YgdD (TMEM256/DUF423 family)